MNIRWFITKITIINKSWVIWERWPNNWKVISW